MVIGELDIGLIPENIPTKEKIVGVMAQAMEVGLKRSTTIPCSTLKKVFMVMVEVDLGLILAHPPPIIQVVLVDHQVLIVMVMTEVDIGLIPTNFIHITIVY